jgi:hypothetical protein
VACHFANSEEVRRIGGSCLNALLRASLGQSIVCFFVGVPALDSRRGAKDCTDWPRMAVGTLEMPVFVGRKRRYLVDTGFCNCDCTVYMLGRCRDVGGQVQERCHSLMHGDTDSVITHCQCEGPGFVGAFETMEGV